MSDSEQGQELPQDAKPFVWWVYAPTEATFFKDLTPRQSVEECLEAAAATEDAKDRWIAVGHTEPAPAVLDAALGDQDFVLAALDRIGLYFGSGDGKPADGVYELGTDNEAEEWRRQVDNELRGLLAARLRERFGDPLELRPTAIYSRRAGTGEWFLFVDPLASLRKMAERELASMRKALDAIGRWQAEEGSAAWKEG